MYGTSESMGNEAATSDLREEVVTAEGKVLFELLFLLLLPAPPPTRPSPLLLLSAEPSVPFEGDPEQARASRLLGWVTPRNVHDEGLARAACGRRGHRAPAAKVSD